MGHNTLTKRKKTKSAKSCTIKDNEKKNPLQRGGFVCPSGVYIVVRPTPGGGVSGRPPPLARITWTLGKLPRCGTCDNQSMNVRLFVIWMHGHSKVN